MTRRNVLGRLGRCAGLVLVTGATTLGRSAEVLEETGEWFVSPVEGRRYLVAQDPGTGEKWLRSESGQRFGSVREIVAAEESRLSALERVLAPDLREIAADPHRADEIVSVILRFRRQPLSEIGAEVRERHHDALQEQAGTVRRLAAEIELRRAEAAGPAGLREGASPGDEERFLSTQELVEMRAARTQLAALQTRMREEVVAAARPAVEADQRRVVESLSSRAGVVVTGRTWVLSTVSARVRAGLLAQIAEEFAEIARIERAEISYPSLDTSAGAVSAGTWWTAGWDGSSGTIVAVLDTGVDADHPALSNVVAGETVEIGNAAADDPAFDDDTADTDDAVGHGTHVGGIVVSQDKTYTGIAPGARILNAKCGYRRDDTKKPAGLHPSDVMQAADWAAGESATVFNYSAGSEGTADGMSTLSLFFDAAAWGLGVPTVVAAGNLGSSSSTVTRPADAFNVIAVGNYDDRNTTSTSDDTIASTSSRGPTADGRRKPDLAAPGTNIVSCSRSWEGGAADFESLSGTSMAAPHAAGALAILQDYGVAAYPWGLKALLLATASAPWGVTTGPDNTWGAGRMNLSGAYTSRASLYEGRLTPSGSQAVFVKFGALDFGDRIALTWPRRVDDDGAEEPTTYHAAPDLDLFVYVENDRQAGSSSRSSVDTVEMADFPGWTVASVVKVVRYGDSFPSGYSSIPFAVASEGTAAPAVATPPSLSIQVTGVPAVVGPGQSFWVTTAVTNSGQIGAGSVDLPLGVPSGYATDRTLYGTSAPAGKTATAQVYVTAAAGPSGTKSLTFQAKSDIYGENYASQVVTIQQVLDADPPTGSITLAGGAAYTNSRVVAVALPASDAHSSVTQVALHTLPTSFPTWGSYVASGSITLPSGDGTQTIYAYFRDQVGNVSAPASDSIVLDTVAPAGSVVVNGGAVWTNAATVTLTCAATDATSGVDQMRFSNDGTNWSAWQPYAASASWTLSGGDGTKTVRVQYRDRAGNDSSVAGDSIGLDTTPPAGLVIVAGGAAWTRVADVACVLDATDGLSGVTSMRLRDGETDWQGWTGYAPSAAWSLAGADGAKTVHAEFRDAAGNVSVAASDAIGLDTTPPALSALSIAGGAPWTSSASVLLALTASDATSGLDVARFSDDGVVWSAWSPYAATRTWSLPGADGQKTVHARVRDLAGNESPVATDTIGLDRVAPAGSVLIADGAAWTRTSDVTAATTASDATSGVTSLRLSADGAVWDEWTEHTPTVSRQLAGQDGTKWLHVQYRDAAGNASTTYADSIGLDRAGPVAAPLVVAGGAPWTRALPVTLAPSATDATSYVVSMSFSNDGETWGEWLPYGSAASWTLTGPDGPCTVWARYLDAAGNESPVAGRGTIGLDRVGPSGTLSIEAGADWTRTRDVSVGPAATDATSGVGAMSFSADRGTTWSAWEPYAAAAATTLADADGERTVHVRFRDVAGNESGESAWDSIGLDRTPPTGAVLVLGGRPAINRADVDLDLTWSDPSPGSQVAEMRVLGPDGATWDAWRPVAPTLPCTLAAGEGVRTARVMVRDLAGNESSVVSDDILIDTTAPAGRIVVNGDARYVAPRAPLRVTGSVAEPPGGSAVDSVAWSADGGESWSSWLPFTALEGGASSSVVDADVPGSLADTSATVAVRFRDAAGNVSEVAADSVYVLPRATQDATRAGRLQGSFAVPGDADCFAVELQVGDRLKVTPSLAPTRPKIRDVRIEVDLIGPDGALVVDGAAVAKKAPAGRAGYVAQVSGTHWVVLRRTGAGTDAPLGYRATADVKFARSPVLSRGAATQGASGLFEATLRVPDGAVGRTLAARFSVQAPLTADLVDADGAAVPLVVARRNRGRAADVRATLGPLAGDFEIRLASEKPFRWGTLRLTPPKRNARSTLKEEPAAPSE